MAKKNVDFLVIGAQKSGTTSLFKYLQQHPSLYLPAQKEVDFFSNDERYAKGVHWYIRTYFSGADDLKMWGEASPQYMSYGCAPPRIHAAFPEARLIAILRNPIDRVYSHYRMLVRRGIETRPFSEMVAERGWVTEVPEIATGDRSQYIVSFGMYGKILERYLQHFAREQILILFQEDLSSDPQQVVARLFSFLGVDNGYVPRNLGQRYHESGRERLPGLNEWIRRRTLLKRTAKALFRKQRHREAVNFWVEQLNTRPVRGGGVSPADREVLREIFEKDVALLKRLLSIRPPWPEFEEPEGHVSGGPSSIEA
ncbi:MAG: hypothetical protein CYG60_11550 [Actinobacteria bacterium]|nr:MAG: hypothetical protein CYG60_11550 [Actinomycetota bacterium]